MHGDALCPEQDIAVSKREPEPIFLKAQQDWIVENTAVGIRNQDIFALPDRHVREAEFDQLGGQPVIAGETLGVARDPRAFHEGVGDGA